MPVTSLAVKRGIAVVVLDRDQHVEQVAILLALGRVGDAAVHDLLHQRNEFDARLVADAEALDVEVRVDVAERIGPALQLVVVLGEPTVELLAELQPDQARRRGVDRQLGEEVEQLDLAFVAPVGDDLLDLVLDGGGVALHLLTAQCGVVQHLRPALGVGVEHHALTEDRRHERVGLGLVEFAVAGAEEELVGLRPDSMTTCLSTSWNQPTSPHSSRMRCIKPIGSVRNSSRWPCSSPRRRRRGARSQSVMASVPPRPVQLLTVLGRRPAGLRAAAPCSR